MPRLCHDCPVYLFNYFIFLLILKYFKEFQICHFHPNVFQSASLKAGGGRGEGMMVTTIPHLQILLQNILNK